MNDAEYQALRNSLLELRTQRVQSTFGEIPKSVQVLWDMLDKSQSTAERADIYPLLLSECSMARNDQVYLYFLRRSGIDLPDDPVIRSGVAYGIALVEPGSRSEALTNATQAMTLAKRQNRFVRYTASNLARIALLLDSYDALEEALSTLIADKARVREVDSPYEFDFVDQIDPQRCSANLLNELKTMAQKK